MSYILFTDSNSDIPFQEVDRYDLKIVYMPYSIDGSDEASDLGRGDVIPNFYAAMRGGKGLRILHRIFDRAAEQARHLAGVRREHGFAFPYVE